MVVIDKIKLYKLKKSLTYIIASNEIISEDTDKNEVIDIHYHKRARDYIVFVNNRFYEINYKTDRQDAEFVMDHIEEITYIYDCNEPFDTVVGNVREFVKKFDVYEYVYYQFVISQKTLFDFDFVNNFFERKYGT